MEKKVARGECERDKSPTGFWGIYLRANFSIKMDYNSLKAALGASVVFRLQTKILQCGIFLVCC